MKTILIALLTTFVAAKGFAQNPPVEAETAHNPPAEGAGAIHNPHDPTEGVGAISEHGKKGEEEHRDNAALFPKKQADVAGQGTPPPAVKLSEPAFQAKVAAGNVSLSWQPSQGATAYHVQVATDPNFKWLKADNHWVKDTHFEAAGLEAGKKYFWRVAPWKDGNVASTNKGAFAASTFETK